MTSLGSGFYRLVLRYGFMQYSDVPAALKQVESCGPEFKMMDTSFFLARQTLLTGGSKPGMALWREKIFSWMLRNAESAMEFFTLPPNRVVEIGSQRSEARSVVKEVVRKCRTRGSQYLDKKKKKK